MALLSDIRDRIENAFETMTTSPLEALPRAQSRQEHNEELFDFVTTANNGEVNTDGSVTIGAVTLPRVVADQLKKLGVSLAFYNEGQLSAAIQACAVDSNLIDDPFGDNFFDGLSLDDDEKGIAKSKAYENENEYKVKEEDKVKEEEVESSVPDEMYARNFLNPGRGSIFSEPPEALGSVAPPALFRERIKSEREERKKSGGMSLSRDDDSSDKRIKTTATATSST